MMSPRSHGSGKFSFSQFAKLGQGVVFEDGVLVFHPENMEIGDNVYIGHYTILKGYHKNKMTIGKGTWIGQQCFFHSAGGIEIGCNVGIGPGVKILTSSHTLDNVHSPILHNPVEFAPVKIRDDSDIGAGAIILPGVTIGIGVQVGAGAVVVNSVSDYAIVVGVPAKILRGRKGGNRTNS
jgi:acetyltransferase-like isoleucine patch superfamily enzyme